MKLIIFLVLSTFITSLIASAEKVDWESAGRGRLRTQARELKAIIAELNSKGDRTVRCEPDEHLIRVALEREWILWGDYVVTDAYPVVTKGKCTWLSQVFTHNSKLFEKKLINYGIETSMWESWPTLLDRILGEGEFANQQGVGTNLDEEYDYESRHDQYLELRYPLP